MALNRIILWLGNSLVLIAMAMAATALTALMMMLFVDAITLAIIALIVAITGVIFIFTTRDTPARETNGDALVFLLVFWITVPLIAAVPYIALLPDLGFRHAYFEAVSAITTTGASALLPEDIPDSLHVWRSSLQWMGGVVTATFAVVVLASLNLRGTGVHRSMLFTLKRGELFERLAGIGWVIASVYGIISGVCFVFLVISGTPIFDAFCLSLTSVSTGGLAPRSGGLESYVSPLGLSALCLTCLLGASNIAVLWDILRLRSRRQFQAYFRNAEHQSLLVGIGIVAVIGFLYTGYRHIPTIITEAVFFISTTGYDHHVIGLDMVPPVILIATALIGGSAISTAGGVKIIRMLLLFKHLETDISRLSHPSRIVPVVYKGRILPDRAFLSIWMYFFGYTFVFALGILALAALGMEFSMAVTTSAASLSNMGPLLDYTLPEYSYGAFSSLQKLTSAALMLIGRVEVLAVLSVFSPHLWRM